MVPSSLVNQTVVQPVNGPTSHCSAFGPLLICESVPAAYMYRHTDTQMQRPLAPSSELAVTQRGDLWALWEYGYTKPQLDASPSNLICWLPWVGLRLEEETQYHILHNDPR